MTDSITPPPELVQQWWEEADQYQDDPKTYFDYVATEAAQWGADQELQAVCQLLFSDPSASYTLSEIRAARRPKPPSLKEQALGMLENAWKDGHISNKAAQTICRALEALPE
jgi:hypothetical protein